jgi:hypothetical protein
MGLDNICDSIELSSDIQRSDKARHLPGILSQRMIQQEQVMRLMVHWPFP